MQVLKEKLDSSIIVFGIRHKGLNVRPLSAPDSTFSVSRGCLLDGLAWQRFARRHASLAAPFLGPPIDRIGHFAQVSTVQRFRKGLPEGASVMVTKNNLMKVAVAQTQGWSTLVEKGCTVRRD